MKLTLSVAFLALAASLFLAAPVFAATNPFSGACQQPGAGASSVCSAGTGDPLTGPHGAIIDASHIIAVIAGVAAVIIIIVAGFMYILSGGDASKVNSAKNMIIYAVVGLVIIGASEAIVVFIVGRV
jgi:hypothetical protein